MAPVLWNQGEVAERSSLRTLKRNKEGEKGKREKRKRAREMKGKGHGIRCIHHGLYQTESFATTKTNHEHYDHYRVLCGRWAVLQE